jgi:hypothetical protein
METVITLQGRGKVIKKNYVSDRNQSAWQNAQTRSCYGVTERCSQLLASYSIGETWMDKYEALTLKLIGETEVLKKPVPVPILSPQMPHRLARDWTQASTVIRYDVFKLWEPNFFQTKKKSSETRMNMHESPQVQHNQAKTLLTSCSMTQVQVTFIVWRLTCPKVLGFWN